MKLFNFDAKHQSIRNALEIPDDPEFIKKLEQVVNWLNENVLITRYSKLEIAKDFDLQYLDGEQELVFK